MNCRENFVSPSARWPDAALILASRDHCTLLRERLGRAPAIRRRQTRPRRQAANGME